jgi:hypothetical protein
MSKFLSIALDPTVAEFDFHFVDVEVIQEPVSYPVNTVIEFQGQRLVVLKSNAR